MSKLVRVSALPVGWSACREVGRRRPVLCWGIFVDDADRLETVGLIARGGTGLVRADRVKWFCGYAAGAGCEPELEAPTLPPTDLNSAVLEALDVDAESIETYETRTRAALMAVAENEWAAVALAEFDFDPRRWIRLWLTGRREREATELALWRRLRALSLARPRLSLLEALTDTGQTLGELLAGPEPAEEV